jgi:hypothetical protein
MKTVTFKKPSLSFNVQILTIEKQENGWHYKVYADGYEIGLILYRNGFDFANNTKVELTDEDRSFLIAAASTLL